MTILVCDDDKEIVEAISIYLKQEGYDIVPAYNGKEALKLMQESEIHLIILDIMMPELDGLSACREIRKKRETPVLMLSARGEEYDRIHGFELGVDYYVVKRFSPRELMMRVNAILKRVHANSQPQKIKFQKDGLVVDFTARQVTVDGKKVNLSPKEYELLFFLVRNRGIALDREKLICEIWGYDFYGDDRTLDTHIKLLRKSLGPYSKQIVTLRGVGYRFDA